MALLEARCGLPSVAAILYLTLVAVAGKKAAGNKGQLRRRTLLLCCIAGEVGYIAAI